MCVCQGRGAEEGRRGRVKLCVKAEGGREREREGGCVRVCVQGPLE